MADDDKDQAAEGEEGAKPDKRKKLLLIGGVALLVLLLAGGAAWFFLAGGDDEDASEDEAVEEVRLPARYHPLGESFIVNLDDDGRARLMEVAVTVMTRDAAAVEAMERHAPLLRSELTMLLGGADFATLRTEQGKSDLQEAIRLRVQRILDQEHGGDAGPPQVEQVFFEKFVLQ
jgi:flagellar FliL protein